MTTLASLDGVPIVQGGQAPPPGSILVYNETAGPGDTPAYASANRTLKAATGAEIGADLSVEINKAADDYTALLINAVETLAPGSDNRLLDLQVNGASQVHATNTGSIVIVGNYGFDGDPDTYMRSPAGDQIDVVVGNGLAMRWANGITTSYQDLVPSPTNTLEIGSAGSAWLEAHVTTVIGNEALAATANGGFVTQGTVTTAAGPATTLTNQSDFAAATAIEQSGVLVEHTVNQVSAVGAGFTSMVINRVETSVDSGAQQFLDLQVGGTSKIAINNTAGLVATLDATGQWAIDAQSYNQANVPDLGLLTLGLQSVVVVQVPDFDVTRGIAVYGTGGNENFAHLGAGVLTLYEPNNFSQINSPTGMEINVTTGNLDMTAGTAVIANSIRFTQNTVPTPDEYTIDSGGPAGSSTARPTLIITGAENSSVGAPGAVQIRGGVASGTNTPGANVQVAGSDSQGTGAAGGVIVAGGNAQGTGSPGGILLTAGNGDANSTSGEVKAETRNEGNSGDVILLTEVINNAAAQAGDILIENRAGPNGTEGGILLSISGGAGPSAPASGQILIETGGEVQIDAFTLDCNVTQVGFYGATPVNQSAAYTRNATIVEDRTLLASASATVTNNNNVLAALIADLQALGLIG